MDVVDLRSDTVTQPTPAMREAMARAEVGDDVYGEDPTVNRLEEIAAAKVGKEAGLFVPSGTMGNLAALLTHCQRGDEVILGNLAHTFLYEAGGMAALGGIHPYPLPNQSDGTLALEDIRAAIRSDDPHFPITRLIALENTHNRCGGAVLSVEYTQRVSELAHEYGLGVHLDGARVFNAAAALDVSVVELCAPVDTVTFCLSKGLCAPVGSVLCGSRAFIHQARRIRKQLGGGMRQAGIIAAAGIVALQQMVDRLAEDHRLARRLAEKLSRVQGIRIESPPATNMVYLSLEDSIPLTADQVAARMTKLGVRVGVVGERRFRLVTHYWINAKGVEQAVRAFEEILAVV